MTLPPPHDIAAHISERVAELADHLGDRELVEQCCQLLTGARREDHLDALRYLSGHSFEEGDGALDPQIWHDYWIRTWGARGLLYVWEDVATGAVMGGLRDEHWRPAEMCLKVATKREVGGAGDGAARLSTHELPRVREQAMRTLGAVGDTEHVAIVESGLDDSVAAVRRQAARALERLWARLDLP